MPIHHLRGLRKYAKPWKQRMASRMSRNPTKPEQILWERLKDKQLGICIYKQKVVLGYILDFWCPGAALCIEVDGPCHDKRKEYDLVRDLALKKKGIHTIRFKIDEVQNNLNAVVALIRAKIMQRVK